MLYIPFETVAAELARGLEKLGCNHEQAVLVGRTMAENSLEGVYTHGVNRFMRLVNNIKDGIVSVFKTVVNGIIRGINKVIATPFKGLNKVLDRIQNVSVAGFQPFSWMSWRANVPQIPLLAKGGSSTKPTLNFAGAAAPEAIIPIAKLESYITGAINKTMNTANLNSLARYIEDLASRPIELKINDRTFAVATAGAADSVNGL